MDITQIIDAIEDANARSERAQIEWRGDISSLVTEIAVHSDYEHEDYAEIDPGVWDVWGDGWRITATCNA